MRIPASRRSSRLAYIMKVDSSSVAVKLQALSMRIHPIRSSFLEEAQYYRSDMDDTIVCDIPANTVGYTRCKQTRNSKQITRVWMSCAIAIAAIAMIQQRVRFRHQRAHAQRLPETSIMHLHILQSRMSNDKITVCILARWQINDLHQTYRPPCTASTFR